MKKSGKCEKSESIKSREDQSQEFDEQFIDAESFDDFKNDEINEENKSFDNEWDSAYKNKDKVNECS